MLPGVLMFISKSICWTCGWSHFFLCQCRPGRDKTHQFHEFPNFLCDENRYVPGTGWPSVEKNMVPGWRKCAKPTRLTRTMSHPGWFMTGSWFHDLFLKYKCPSFLRWVGQISSSKKKTSNMSPRVSPIFHTAGWWIRIPVIYPKDFMDPIPAADEDSIQLVGSSGTMVGNPVRWSQWLGIHRAPEAFGIYRDLFRRRNIARILQYFFVKLFACYKLETSILNMNYGPWILKITRS